ncbi:polymorphic toxin-type HINT domain-containing protein [Streptomyces sp. NPDC002676]
MPRRINHDHDLVDVTIQTGRRHTDVLHTTSKHPFWDDTFHSWMRAGHLKPGHNLETATNHHARILTVRTRTGAADMYNLTVQQLHTYYVLAGVTPVLVHNCHGSIEGHSTTCSCDPENPRSEVTLDRDSFEAARNSGLDIVGTLDTGTRQTLRGRLESAVETFGKVTGFTEKSGGEYREFRLDVDPVKGAHINVMTGKGAAVRKYAIRWPSDTVAPWLKVLQK